MNAKQLLTHAAQIYHERELQYGDPCDSLKRIADRWSVTLEQEITPAQVALCMLDLKMARLQHDKDHLDSIVDLCGYAACLSSLIQQPSKEV